MNVGKRVKELRRELKVSQKELGELLDVAQQQISYYENSGNIDVPKLSKISEHYNIDIRYFFEERPLNDYKGIYMVTNSLSDMSIPAGWDDILEDLSNLEYEKIKVIESVIKTLIKEFSK
jgi:transcriptional regulator with XRE-family HTH domain